MESLIKSICTITDLVLTTDLVFKHGLIIALTGHFG